MMHLPSALTYTNNLVTHLNWHDAEKTFIAASKIPDVQWVALKKAVTPSPSSYGLQPWNFQVIRDRAIRERLFLASMRQRKVVDCSYLIVFAVRTDITEQDISRWASRLAKVQHIPDHELSQTQSVMHGDLLTGQRHVMAHEWAKRQAYLALTLFLTYAAVTGIETCPMEGFDPKAYDDILGFTDRGYTTSVVATAGHRRVNDKRAHDHKVRFPIGEVIINV